MELLKTKTTIFFATMLLAAFTFSGCYKDNEEELYPENGNSCDTENVSFADQVWPVINNNCVACHSGAGASAGIRMGNHAELVQAVNGGRFVGAIKHESGFSAMPQGGGKLNDCSIQQIEAWIADGMPDN
jgi:cytochrome c5